jgi:leucyl-tRNA synthetase
MRGFFISLRGSDAMSDESTDSQPASAAAARPTTAGPATEGSPPAAALPPYRYDARLAEEIELRWQDYWAAAGTFESPNPSGPLSTGFRAGQPKFYVLDMFPYASGTGIHVGHPEGYIATDVYARYLRMTGHHVLHTMGFDSFGLPAEQFALGTGQHPRVTTRQNTDNMRQQLRRLGLGHDARRSVDTTDPGFYRWTQWIFLKIFDSWVDERTGRASPIAELVAEYESGQRMVPGDRDWAALTDQERRQLIDGRRLAYVAEEPVNWCPGLGTVLANEEVTADGRSDIGDFPVYRRPMRQWMLRITAMAERLIDDLDGLSWPESVKQLQRNWIGASDGAIITLRCAERPDVAIDVFSTRPDTLYGATFVVLAPEHPLVDRLAADTWPDGTPVAWRRTEADPRAAIRAYRAATAELSDRQRTAAGAKSGVFTGAHAINPLTGDPVPIFIADYVLMGYGTGAIMAVPAHDERDLEFARAYDLPVRQVIDTDGRYVDVPGLPLAGLDTPAAIATSIGWLDRGGHGLAARRFRLRDWLFSRQRYWGEPFPIVYDADGQPLALPESALPVLLPELTDFRPEPGAGEPVPPLARATDWATVELDLGHGPAVYRRELNTMPQWAGSCWYYLRYLDPDNDAAFVDPDVERYWMKPGGVDLYIGGVEHAVLHLLYARFWHKVLYDLGLVSTPEPFARLVNQGMIQAEAFVDERGIYVPAADVVVGADGAPSYLGRPVTRRSGKMGKSLKNGVSPEEMYRRYGADTLRLYEMAMGPLEVDKPWRTDDVIGVHRLLQRIWRSIVDEQTGSAAVSDAPLDAETARVLHATIAAVRRDFGFLRFNTAIARLTELVTVAARLAGPAGAGRDGTKDGPSRGGGLPRALAEPLVLMVAPLAPHVAEELWAKLGCPPSVAYAPFPAADPDLAQARTVTVPVQVNGRTRFRIEVPAGLDEASVEAAVRADPTYARWTDGMSIERLIVVPDRVVNIVVRGSLSM